MRQGDGIDLVVGVQTLDVLPVRRHDGIDEVVDRGILIANEHVAVQNLVVTQDVVQHLLVKVLWRRLERDFHAASLFRLEVDIRRLAIEADSHGFQLLLEEAALLCLLGGVQHHEDHVARFRGGDDLASATLAFGGALDDTGEIEDLDLGAAVLQDTWDGCEGRESVGRYF